MRKKELKILSRIVSSKEFGWFLSLLFLGFVTGSSSTAEVWREATFNDFADGTFDDAGANVYVSAGGAIKTINRWDVNEDGYIDILCVNSHPLVEMLDMSIYWGNSQDFSIERHSYVPADGPMRVAAGDLNNDGNTDLVVANFSNGTWTQMDSSIYWGTGQQEWAQQKGNGHPWQSFPFRGKTNLPAQNTQGVVVADLNGDDTLDIALAFSAGFWEYRGQEGESPSRIYWNRKGQFSREDFTELGTRGATAVDAADFNGDGWNDLVFANGKGPESYVFPGGAQGFARSRRIALPTVEPHSVRFADVDNDRAYDLLFANEGGDASFAYLNRQGTFSPQARLEFTTYNAKDVEVADFDGDGYNDVFFTNHLHSLTGERRFGNRLIESYLYYGSETGFSDDRRQGLQTIGAWDANTADLNRDGWIDLVVCNFQEHYSYEVPSFVYWNGPGGFDVTRRTPLYEHGAQGNEIADFNGDGHLDLLITSMMGGSRGDYDPSYLYFGDKSGNYRVENRISLVGREPYEQAMADLNDDSQVDLLLLNQGEVTRYENELWIYWNERGTFDPWRITGLPAYAGVGIEVADLDRDGHLDIIIANNKNYSNSSPPGVQAAFPKIEPGSFIYWGSTSGWVVTERTELNVFLARSPSIADIDGDGFLDLVFAGPSASIFFGDGARGYGDHRRLKIPGTLGRTNHQTEVADLNRDGFLDIVFAGPKVLIYYGDSSHTYGEENRTVLEVQAKTMNIADVDGDGWLDLLCPLYKEAGKRTLRSSVLLGGPAGFDVERRIEFPTDGATGGMISDFNADGYMDVFFFCHRKDGDSRQVGRFGDHHTDSRLYFGSSSGFDTSHFLPLPSIGVHYDVGVDLGHIRNRTFQWVYRSSPHAYSKGSPSSIDWQAETPAGTSIKFQIRTARSEEELASSDWLGPAGAGTYFTTRASPIPEVDGTWIQYRAYLDTKNGAISPVLNEVSIAFE